MNFKKSVLQDLIKFLESNFCLLLVVEAFPPQNVVKMLEEVVGSCQEVGWIGRMRQNFCANLISLLSGISDGKWLVFAKQQNMDLVQGRVEKFFLFSWVQNTHTSDTHKNQSKEN